MTHARTMPTRRVSFALSFGVVLLLLVVVRIAGGVEKAMHFDGAPVDGPFQLLNVLRRIGAGQRAGVDFQFFHGIALPFLHYPLYRIFGGGLAGSELSRQFIAILAAPIVSLLFFWYFTKDVARTVALTTIVYLAELALPLGAITTPLVSMIGVRSSLPVLVPLAIVANDRRRARIVWSGLLLGLSLVVGTEQGLAALVAFVGVGAIAVGSAKRRYELAAEVATAVLIAIGTLIVASLALGGVKGMAGSLRYNLVLVPRDQYWYFGAPASAFLPDWRSLPHMLRQFPRIGVAIALGAIMLAVQVRRLGDATSDAVRRRTHALAILVATGLVSCASVLGIFHDIYVEPCLRILLLVAALDLSAWIEGRPVSDGQIARDYTIVAGLLGAALVIMVPSMVGATFSTLPHVVRAHIFGGRGQEPSGIWPDALRLGQQVVDGSSAHEMWSTYSGWLEANNGVFNPTPFDYMMHALGPANRDRYLETFVATKPQLVQTVLPTFAKAEIWTTQTSWPFYDQLLRHYRAVAASPWSVFWQRTADSLPEPEVIWSERVATDARRVELPMASVAADSAPFTLLDVQVEYDTRSAIQHLPVVGAWPRYFVTIEHAASRFPVTLDPYATRQRFPVVARRGENPSLRFDVYSLVPGARLTIRGVTVARAHIGDNAQWLAVLAAAESARDAAGPGNDTTGVYRWR